MGISSREIRKHAIEAYESGRGTQAQIATLYDVDISTLQRWLQRYRKTGDDGPLPRGHNRAALDESQMETLGALVEATPGVTLAQLREALNVSCSLVAIHNALNRLGYRYKKNAARERTRTP